MSPIKFPTKRLLPNFHILQITKMMSFCNLERPSYFKPIYFILSKVADDRGHSKKLFKRRTSVKCVKLLQNTFIKITTRDNVICRYLGEWTVYRNSLWCARKPWFSHQCLGTGSFRKFEKNAVVVKLVDSTPDCALRWLNLLISNYRVLRWLK